MVILSVVVFVITGEGEDYFRTKCWVGADLIWAEFTAVTKGREVAGEGVNEGLFSRNGVQVVDEENRH